MKCLRVGHSMTICSLAWTRSSGSLRAFPQSSLTKRGLWGHYPRSTTVPANSQSLGYITKFSSHARFTSICLSLALTGPETTMRLSNCHFCQLLKIFNYAWVVFKEILFFIPLWNVFFFTLLLLLGTLYQPWTWAVNLTSRPSHWGLETQSTTPRCEELMSMLNAYLCFYLI